jgi:solute carrier family 25 ornithine transporter 2/15
MYRGLGSTVAREMPGYYVFFLAYEASRTYLNKWLQNRQSLVSTHIGIEGTGIGGGGHYASGNYEEPAWVTMTAGAAAGTCLWLVVYPVDAIKSRIQATGGSVPENSSICSNGSFFKTCMKLIRNEGPMALYRGLAPTLLRTVPASAVMFWTVERTKTLLSSHGL